VLSERQRREELNHREHRVHRERHRAKEQKGRQSRQSRNEHFCKLFSAESAKFAANSAIAEASFVKIGGGDVKWRNFATVAIN
jgi:predicted RecB family nuclease